MTTYAEVQQLATELTSLAPPPDSPLGINVATLASTGRWTIERLNYGGYAIRATYTGLDGQPVVIAIENEIRGTLPNIASALRFTLQVAKSSRLYWRRII